MTFSAKWSDLSQLDRQWLLENWPWICLYLVRGFYVACVGAISLARVLPSFRYRFLSYGARSQSQQASMPLCDGVTRGENMPVGLLDRLASVDVPHNWFTHFYLLSVFCSISWFAAISLGPKQLKGPKLDGQNSQLQSGESAVICLSLLLIHGTRRLLECVFVLRASDSRMWIGHYAFGLAFYLFTNVAVWIESVDKDGNFGVTFSVLECSWPSFKVSAALIIFTLAAFVQYQAHLYLAGLQKYTLPTGPFFTYMVAPHYSAECIIYAAIAVIGAPEGRLMNWTLAAVVLLSAVNLGITAAGTKSWMLNKFREDQRIIATSILLLSYNIVGKITARDKTSKMVCAIQFHSWTTCLITFYVLFSYVYAYRPVQHCKHIGDNGHYSACAALTQTENATSGHLDLYLRYHWYRYKSSNKGWHAFAIGDEMAGAHMFVVYGDPTAPSSEMTVSVRTAEGHRQPRPIAEFSRFEPVFVPSTEVVIAKFEEYKGSFVHPKHKIAPSHVGILEIIVRSWGLWPGQQKIQDGSTSQSMLWSSNFDQDFQGDFSSSIRIDMHEFGNGFGPLQVDMANAKTPEPMFGPIDELAGLKGTSETRAPKPPTKEELAAGEAYIASVRAAQKSASDSAISDPVETQSEPAATTSPDEEFEKVNSEPNDGAIPNPVNPGDSSSTPVEETPPFEQPANTILGKTLRDWMWHLHGLAMCFSFLGLYPLGAYLLRRPPNNGNGFNFHWTIQSLSTVSLGIGAVIGWFNSRGISITHQYIGLFMVFIMAIQIFLGWRHHVIYVATKRRTLFSVFHVWSGRFILLLGYFNIILGMRRRGYGWFTMLLVFATIVVESAFLVFVLRSTGNGRVDSTAARDQGVTVTSAEAEEYFQLAADDEDDWSETEGDSERNAENDAAAAKREERRKQAERLAKLDRV